MTTQKIALIPAYEPGGALVLLARGLAQAGFSVVVVNDGSNEQVYSAVFGAVGRFADVVNCPQNCGKGHALKLGLQEISSRFPHEGVIVTLDSDGQHTVSDASRVAAEAALHPGDLTLGVRAFGAGTPARSRFGNAVTREVFHLATGGELRDTQTGLRAFGFELVPELLGIAGERYEYEMNVLMEFSRRSVPLREVPIQTIYEDNNSGSHFHTFRDSFRIYGNILKFAASSLTGFAVDYGLFSLLSSLLSPIGALSIPVSNVAARVVSAGTNYTINRRLVFKSKENALKTGLQYFALAACILAGNTVLLSWLVSIVGVNRYAAKLLTEVTFFTLSWLVQRFVIFRAKAPSPAAVAPGRVITPKTREAL